jgi:Fe-S oxidoreductase
MSEPNVSYRPTPGLCYDPEDPRYWDEAGLDAEVTRVFEVCHGCRMCFKYCDSFPRLFELLDDKLDGDVRRLGPADKAHVMEACFQCKLCEVQCPYTPRDGHEFQLDFPRLVHRFRAHRARARGRSLRERVLGDPDRAAGLARASLGLANVMNRVALHRLVFEKVVGVHRDKLLPEFAGTTFEAWARAEGLTQGEPGAEVVLFQTCYVQHNEPEIGKDTVEVLRANGLQVRCVEGLVCCGMPAWESGDLDGLRAKARQNLDRLAPHVERGSKVAAINPTCSMMLRREWPELVAGPDRERARAVAAATVDPGELLWSIRGESRFNPRFRSTPGVPVAYHAPCHLRAQAVGFKSRDLLRKIPGVEPQTVMECCGHDGTSAMTVEGFEYSQRVGQRAFSGMQAAKTEIWATDCPLAALQFAQHAGVRPLHPMSLLARAYRADGFATPVAGSDDAPGGRTGP